jgi:hypothetical protein
MKSPFRFGMILPPGAAFCARPELAAAILANSEDRQRLALLGDRRNGKSTIVEHTLHGTGKDLLISVDLAGLASTADFVERFRASTQEALAGHSAVGGAVQRVFNAVKSIKVTVPAVGGVEFSPEHASTVRAVLKDIDALSEWRRTTVFFDEFHEVVDRLDKTTAGHVLGVLKSAIQRQTNTAYVFAGSAKDSMAEIFTGQASEFYKQASLLDVGPIPRVPMEKFLTEQFAKGGRTLDKSGADAIFLLAGETPSDLQELSHQIWARSAPGVIGRQEIRDGFGTAMQEYRRVGERVLSEATPSQKRLLFALALRSTDAGVFGDEFRTFASFETPQAVASSVKAFTEGRTAILEKRAGNVLFRERFMRLWLVGEWLRNPSQFHGVPDQGGEWLQLVKPFVSPDVFRDPLVGTLSAARIASQLPAPPLGVDAPGPALPTTAAELLALLKPARDFYASTNPAARREILAKGLAFIEELGGSGTTKIPLRVAAKEFVQGAGDLEGVQARAAAHFAALDKSLSFGRGRARGGVELG